MSLRFSILLTAVVASTALATTQAMAETYWLSEPGFCGVDEGEIEEEDIIYLTKSGINSHFFNCEWPLKAGSAIQRSDQTVTTDASCENATSTWQAEFEIVPQRNGSVRVFQESGGISPVLFFRCE